MLQLSYKIAQASQKTGVSCDELVDIFKHKSTRRRFLYGSCCFASTLFVSSWHEKNKVVANAVTPKVLVVGAGIAGLTAAYRLRQAGVAVDIVEARNRVGGRIFTVRNVANSGIYADIGGEFINTNHVILRRLAKELGLQTVNLYAADKGLVPLIRYYEGRIIKDSEFAQWNIPLVKKIKQDLAAIDNISIDSINYTNRNPTIIKLDNTSITEYLEQVEINPILRKILQNYCTRIYGVEAAEQSCLNMLVFLNDDDNDERYQIKGGNDKITNLLAKSLSNFIETGTELEAISTQPDGRYRVTLRSDNRAYEKIYEFVVLTLPYTALRTVALNVDLPPVKQKAIAELSYGTNSKLITAYRERIWRTRYKSTGFMSTDLDIGGGWEATRNHNGSAGLITSFTGGKQGIAVGQSSISSLSQSTSSQIDKIFSGISSLSQGEAVRAYWVGEQYTQGSYACYSVGQWTSISGAEQQSVGNLLFAGEHCSRKFQGYMEGSCRTGEIAAKKIIQSLS